MIYTTQINDFELSLNQTKQEETRKIMFEDKPRIFPAEYTITIKHTDPEIIQVLYEKIKELLK